MEPPRAAVNRLTPPVVLALKLDCRVHARLAGIGLACGGVAADGLRAAGLDKKHWLNGCYAQWFDWRHGYEGHVFERRFWSELIRTDWHFFEAARYIVLNPVRARLRPTAEDWEWSSYRAMVGLTTKGPKLSPWLLGEFGPGLDNARTNFAAFIRAAE